MRSIITAVSVGLYERIYHSISSVSGVVWERFHIREVSSRTKSLSADVALKPVAWKSHHRTRDVNGYHAVL
jgi:hypothetical protein